MAQDYYELLAKWETLNGALKELKEKELELRKKLVAHYFPKPKEGPNTYNLPNNYKLKCDHKINRSVNSQDLMEVLSTLNKNEADYIWQTGFRQKVDLNIAGFKSFNDATKALLSKAVTAKEGAPTLRIVAPKKKK